MAKEQLTPEALQAQITARATPGMSKISGIEERVPAFARGAVHRVFSALDLHRPPVGHDQDIIPLGFLPERPSHRLITRAIISLARPHQVEARRDRNIVQEVREHMKKGNLMVVANHLSHADGPQVTKVLQMHEIENTTSILGLRIVRNPVASRMMQGVPIITVYPDSEQFWRSEEYASLEETLTPEEREYVSREKNLARRMQGAAAMAIRERFNKKHPILIFLEGTRNPDTGLGEPVPGAAGVIKRGEDVKILVMTLMGTENMLPKGSGPRFARVRTRFVDLLDPTEITERYKEAHPDAGSQEVNQHLLDQIMKTMAEGLEPKYRGMYSEMVEVEHEFEPLEKPRSRQPETIQRIKSRLAHRLRPARK